MSGMITQKEAAKRLGISIRTLQNWKNAGKISPVPNTKSWYTQEIINEFLHGVDGRDNE